MSTRTPENEGAAGVTAPRFVGDLEGWHRWQAAQNPLRTLKHRLRPAAGPDATLLLGSDSPALLCVLEHTSPSNLAAVGRVLAHRPVAEWAILTSAAAADSVADAVAAVAGSSGSSGPSGLTDSTGHRWTRQRWDTDESAPPAALDGVAAVLSAAHYTGLGALADRFARSRDLPHLVVQHGLITPLTPPVVPGLHVLTWSAADAAYWNADSSAQTTVVGSQLFWETARLRPEHPDQPAPAPGDGGDGNALLYLGQLHGAELPTRSLARSASAFCRTHQARYRPHPGERDRTSRLLHARMRRQGIVFDPGTTPLAANRTPVVSVFSTGVLEAAARGVPAWVSYDAGEPPAWLRGFWERYALHRYGSDGTAPTPPPATPREEPARVIADLLGRHL